MHDVHFVREDLPQYADLLINNNGMGAAGKPSKKTWSLLIYIDLLLAREPMAQRKRADCWHRVRQSVASQDGSRRASRSAGRPLAAIPALSPLDCPFNLIRAAYSSRFFYRCLSLIVTGIRRRIAVFFVGRLPD